MNTLNADGWSAIWTPDSSGDIQTEVVQHAKSVLGQKILSYLRDHLHTIVGKNTVEIGCGGAIYSLLLAKEGANITLLDYSSEALKLAEKNLRSLNLDANLVQGDAFHPPLRLNYFDVALSFGTVEHYKYPHRYEICKMHAELLKPGGVVLIETPNAAFIPHEILKRMLQRSGKWAFGYEKGFSYREMMRTGNDLKLKHQKIAGSSLQSDLNHYYRIFRNSSTIRRFLKAPSSSSQISITQRRSIFDDKFARSIALLGVKPESAD